MAKKNLTIKLKIRYLPFIAFAVAIILVTAGAATFFSAYYARIYPGVFIDGINVGGMTKEEALGTLGAQMQMPTKIIVRGTPTEKIIETSSFSANYDIQTSAALAYEVGRAGNIVEDLKNIGVSITNGTTIPPQLKYNDQALTEQVTLAALDTENQPIKPSVSYEKGQILVNRGKEGYEADLRKLKNDIISILVSRDTNEISLSKKYIDPRLSTEGENTLRARAELISDKNILLTFEGMTFKLDSAALVSTINPQNGFTLDTLDTKIKEVQGHIEREPKNPVFNFSDGRVVEFSPALDGIVLQKAALLASISSALSDLSSQDIDAIEVPIPVMRTAPALKTEDVNNLGIKELIGRGTSKFRGSIPSRVHNVALAASRVNGTLIAPGETFSFNKAVGDISALSGYKQSYVIQGNQTVLGDGGGVCQVSTTVFRAALQAGLPILERHPHSYRVGYYEQDSPPGIDATIYSPGVDLKIKNDTPGHILIQAIADTKNLTLAFEIYGTSDGRVSSTSKPIVSNITPPPEDLYIDDPNLPTGTIEHIDYKAWGARVTFDYSVKRNGETIYEKKFASNYKPWQAKYLRGTGPVQ